MMRTMSPARHAGGARDDNRQLAARCANRMHLEEHNDVATASLIEVWIDEAEGRIWFLYETSCRGEFAAGG